MNSREYAPQCLICQSWAHRTADCFVSNVAHERDSPVQRDNFGLASNDDFRLRNNLDLGPLEDQYGKVAVERMASRLERPRSPSPTPDLPPAQVPDAPARKRRVAPLTRNFRVAKRRLSFAVAPSVSYTTHLALDNQYTILRHKYNRLLGLYAEAYERAQEVGRGNK